jgi:hypothetical protein
MTQRLVTRSLLACSLALVGCSTTHTPSATDAGRDPDGGAVDLGRPVDAGGDSASPVDGATPPATCEPMDAHIDVCGAPCFGITSAFWDGSACVEAHCDCAGADCDVYPDAAACNAAHATCDAALCTSTGGAWFSRPEWCGHFMCGFPSPAACAVPTPACDCGTYRNFMDGVGCVDGALCELLAPTTPDVLCANTGGAWTNGICGNTTCGRYSGLDCASPGCVCGPLEIFDVDRGCIRSPSCDVRLLGESCDDTGLCGGGSVCCVNGGASIASSCVAPACADPAGVCGPPRP